MALYTASFNAIKLEIASINGGSPTALERLITFSLLKPRSYISTLKLNGVKYVNWDSKSSNFSIIYNSKKVTIDEIRTRIAEVGHDNGEYKASLETYDELPNCCRYRHTGKH